MTNPPHRTDVVSSTADRLLSTHRYRMLTFETTGPEPAGAAPTGRFDFPSALPSSTAVSPTAGGATAA